jgi:hypothetical protein
MATKEQLENLTEQWRKGSISSDDLARELRGLLHTFPDAYFREKVRSAVELAEAFSSPRKTERYGGRRAQPRIVSGG